MARAQTIHLRRHQQTDQPCPTTRRSGRSPDAIGWLAAWAEGDNALYRDGCKLSQPSTRVPPTPKSGTTTSTGRLRGRIGLAAAATPENDARGSFPSAAPALLATTGCCATMAKETSTRHPPGMPARRNRRRSARGSRRRPGPRTTNRAAGGGCCLSPDAAPAARHAPQPHPPLQRRRPRGLPDGRPLRRRRAGRLFITMARRRLDDRRADGLHRHRDERVAPVRRSPEELVNKFAHQLEPQGHHHEPRHPFAKSLVDYIFRWLGMEFIDGYREENAPGARRSRRRPARHALGRRGRARQQPGRRNVRRDRMIGIPVDGQEACDQRGSSGRLKRHTDVNQRLDRHRPRLAAAWASPATGATGANRFAHGAVRRHTGVDRTHATPESERRRPMRRTPSPSAHDGRGSAGRRARSFSRRTLAMGVRTTVIDQSGRSPRRDRWSASVTARRLPARRLRRRGRRRSWLRTRRTDRARIQRRFDAGDGPSCSRAHARRHRRVDRGGDTRRSTGRTRRCRPTRRRARNCGHITVRRRVLQVRQLRFAERMLVNAGLLKATRLAGRPARQPPGHLQRVRRRHHTHEGPCTELDST